MTKQEMMRINKEKGFFFFSSNNIYFFRSKVESPLYKHPKDKEIYLFISSEEPYKDGYKEYRIRTFNKNSGVIETLKGACEFRYFESSNTFIKKWLKDAKEKSL